MWPIGQRTLTPLEQSNPESWYRLSEYAGVEGRYAGNHGQHRAIGAEDTHGRPDVQDECLEVVLVFVVHILEESLMFSRGLLSRFFP